MTQIKYRVVTYIETYELFDDGTESQPTISDESRLVTFSSLCHAQASKELLGQILDWHLAKIRGLTNNGGN